MNELGDDLGTRSVSVSKESALFWELLDSPDTTVEFPTLKGRKKRSSVPSDQNSLQNEFEQTAVEELQRTNLGSNSTNTSTGVEQQLCNKSSTTKRASLKEKFVDKSGAKFPVERSASHNPSNKIADRDNYFVISLFSQFP